MQISVYTVSESYQEHQWFLTHPLVSDLKYTAFVLFLASVELLCPYPWQMEGEWCVKKKFDFFF